MHEVVHGGVVPTLVIILILQTSVALIFMPHLVTRAFGWQNKPPGFSKNTGDFVAVSI